MKSKRNAIILLIIGAIIFLAGIVVPIVSMRIYTSQHGAIGIIGGADGPTAIYLTSRLFSGTPIIFMLLGLGLVVSAVVLLIVLRKKK
jgi:Na+-transporting methylmalonyl-CoA/oxaloacetate decarboxylase beta subunit